MRFLRGVSALGKKLTSQIGDKDIPNVDTVAAQGDPTDAQTSVLSSTPLEPIWEVQSHVSQESTDTQSFSDSCSIGTRSSMMSSMAGSSQDSGSSHVVTLFGLHEMDEDSEAFSESDESDIEEEEENRKMGAGRQFPADATGRAPSEGHSTGECRPCVFVNSKVGCFQGGNCNFCHLPHAKKVRPRLRLTKERMHRLAQTGQLGDPEELQQPLEDALPKLDSHIAL